MQCHYHYLSLLIIQSLPEITQPQTQQRLETHCRVSQILADMFAVRPSLSHCPLHNVRTCCPTHTAAHKRTEHQHGVIRRGPTLRFRPCHFHHKMRVNRRNRCVLVSLTKPYYIDKRNNVATLHHIPWSDGKSNKNPTQNNIKHSSRVPLSIKLY